MDCLRIVGIIHHTDTNDIIQRIKLLFLGDYVLIMIDHSRTRVLHVDDDSMYREWFASRIEAETELSVTTAASADAALSRLTDDVYDCLVSAYDLPGTDGLELLRSVRARNPSLPVVLHTGSGSESLASEAIAAGVTDYVPKVKGKDQGDALARRVELAIDRSAGSPTASDHPLSDHHRDAFVRLVSHDLRNSMVVMPGLVDGVYEDGDRALYREARDALGRMNAVVDDLETLVRNDGSHPALDSFELSSIATAAWERLDTGASELRAEYGPLIAADPAVFRQVLQTLFSNSIAHATSNVTVRVGVTDDRDGFYVADDGPYIATGGKNHAFETADQDDELGFVREVAATNGWVIEVTESSLGGPRIEFLGLDFEDRSVGDW